MLEGAPLKLRLGGCRSLDCTRDFGSGLKRTVNRFTWAGFFGVSDSDRRKHPSSFSYSSRPMRFNFHHSTLARRVMAEAAPLPVLWFFHQSALNGIAMDITKLLDKLAVAPNVEIVIPRLPERIFRPQRQPARDALLQ